MPLPVPEIPFKIGLIHRENGATHEGEVRLATLDDAAVWEKLWLPHLGQEYASWRWREHIERAAHEDGYLVLAAATEDGLQGLASYAYAPSAFAKHQTVVYVDLLCGAPRQVSVLREAGLGLLRTAAIISMELNHEGRVGLHSKSPEKLQQWYKSLGFLEVGWEDGYLRLELPPENVSVLLEE